MASVDLPQALSYLQISNDIGGSVYEHLVNLVTKVLEEKPTNAVDLQELSLLAKKTAFDGKETSPLLPLPVVADNSKAVAAAKLFEPRELPVDPETGEPVAAEPANDYVATNVVAEANLMDALGVGLGQQEMYNVSMVIKKLGEDPIQAFKSIRFFGKFFGLYNDYYVFEVLKRKSPDIPDAPAGEVPFEKGAGSNAFTYLVCTSLGGALQELPFVQPKHVKSSRQIRKFLTGHLTSHVSTYPAFPGTEANYLRALIARIACATVACPAGSFTPNEEKNNELEPTEDFEFPPGNEMAQVSNWQHMRPHLKGQGRCEVFKREVPEDADEEEFLNDDEKEEGPELLGSLEEDAPLPNTNKTSEGEAEPIPAWSPLLSSCSEAVKNQVGGIRSLVWPGAYCAAKGSTFCSIYVGWGVKNAPFVPVPPPPVTGEFDFAAVETQELALKPAPPPPEEEEGGGEDE